MSPSFYFCLLFSYLFQLENFRVSAPDVAMLEEDFFFFFLFLSPVSISISLSSFPLSSPRPSHVYILDSV